MPGSSRIIKHTVVSSGLHDADIRPPALLGEFKRLSLRDAARFFETPDSREEVPCPACGKAESAPAFNKDGFSFVRCDGCQSLYTSPRPRAKDLARYFAESEASRFRAAQFAEGSAAQRRHHLLSANASWMGRIVEESALPPHPAYADIRTYAPQLFDEVAELGLFGHLFSAEPWAAISGRCAPEVIESTLDALPPVHTISAFEKLEHQHSPQAFLESLGAHLAPGGLLFLTTRTSSGFDIQMLWDKAPYIFVPEHLNLLSVAGLGHLVQRSGFELVELSTPGQLDVELVMQACAADPSIVLPRFFNALITKQNALAQSDFQAFLQKHRLSSHVRLVLRKPD